MFRRALNKLLGPLGLKLVPKHHDELLYQHDYGSGGYEAYRQLQIGWNKAKIDAVWADERTLKAIAEDVERRGLKTGLCHGARNGYEVEWFRKRLGTEVIGTDISDTATRFPNMVVQDFHEPRSEWLGKWDFIYTNSLDQAFDPRKALDTWSEQLGGGGCIYIEHTMQHSASGASEMDPFGAHPMAMPYLLFKRGHRLADIIEVEQVAGKGRVWVFVIESPDGKAG